MALTSREKQVMASIKEWEESLYSYSPNDLEVTYDKYVERVFSLLPEETQKQFYIALDSWLFHLHALIQGSQLQFDAKERILSAGRVFDQRITQIEDLKHLSIDQLQYIAEQQISRHRLYSFAQGGMSGTGGTLLLGVDLPAVTVINLRVIQLIAMTYGYEVNTPFEMMNSLKVFHAATHPVRMQVYSWEELKQDFGKHREYFYEGKEELTDITWMEQPLKQIFKSIAILFFKNKTLQGIPLISMAIGAGSNYQLTRKVTDFAHSYYQLRYLTEKENTYDE
ncbi:EcsC protein family [Mycobacteroides abscessus subsp. abscessus]|nr:EcsC protein family [Mycobacteroides abscessus subsp. abscessus]